MSTNAAKVVQPQEENVQVEAESTVTLYPRMTFAPPNAIKNVNEQVAEHHSLTTLANRYIPESIGWLKGDHKVIIMKLDQLLEGIADIKVRLERLESAE